MLASAGGKKNSIRFDAYVAGAHVTSGSMASNSEEGTPITFALSSTGRKSERAFTKACAKARVTGTDAVRDNTPCDDGVENLPKYTFNMKFVGPDSRTMGMGGGAGLPAISQEGSGPAGIFRFEFVRRIGSGLIYTPKKSDSLSTPSWIPLTDIPAVTPIDASWERVIYEDPLNLTLVPRCCGIVEVEITLP